MPKRVQGLVACLNTAADPATVLPIARRGACFKHLRERGVARHGEAVASHGTGQRLRQVEAIKRQDRAQSRLNPEDFRIIAAVRHRKDAAAIGKHEQFRLDHGRGHRRMHNRRIADWHAKMHAQDAIVLRQHEARRLSGFVFPGVVHVAGFNAASGARRIIVNAGPTIARVPRLSAAFDDLTTMPTTNAFFISPNAATPKRRRPNCRSKGRSYPVM